MIINILGILKLPDQLLKHVFLLFKKKKTITADVNPIIADNGPFQTLQMFLHRGFFNRHATLRKSGIYVNRHQYNKKNPGFPGFFTLLQLIIIRESNYYS